MHPEEDRDCLTCDYCRTKFFPEKNADGIRILAEASGLERPVCAVPLADAALARHRILYCTRCRGSLMPMRVFTSLVEDLRAQQSGGWQMPRPPDPKQLRAVVVPWTRSTTEGRAISSSMTARHANSIGWIRAN